MILSSVEIQNLQHCRAHMSFVADKQSPLSRNVLQKKEKATQRFAMQPIETKHS